MKFTLTAFIAICILSTFSFTTTSNISSEINKPITVIIDVSHGGKDGGNVFENLKEKEIVFQISQQLKIQNLNSNITLLFTRNGDEFIALKERVAYINEMKPDLVISLHLNAHKDPSANGTEIFVSEKCENYEVSNSMARTLKDRLSEEKLFKNIKIKNADFLILKNTDSPAILIEFGFMSNETDRETLSNPEKISQISTTLLDFISKI